MGKVRLVETGDGGRSWAGARASANRTDLPQGWHQENGDFAEIAELDRIRSGVQFATGLYRRVWGWPMSAF